MKSLRQRRRELIDDGMSYAELDAEDDDRTDEERDQESEDRSLEETHRSLMGPG